MEISLSFNGINITGDPYTLSKIDILATQCFEEEGIVEFIANGNRIKGNAKDINELNYESILEIKRVFGHIHDNLSSRLSQQLNYQNDVK